jgi:predicted metal-dependent HD superfamily phosphohydrolase
MASTTDSLLHRWRAIGIELGWPPDEADSIGHDLVTRYQEPHRHYHDLAHLAFVLDVLDELAAPLSPPATARLAAWFHDAIYTGASGADEEASARLAEARLTAIGLADADAHAVAEMVRATATHFDPDVDHDALTALVLDADLAILAADAASYDAYTTGVRAEYAQVPDDRFTSGRLTVVESLLARPRLFLTPEASDRFDQPARANLARERARLRSAAAN